MFICGYGDVTDRGLGSAMSGAKFQIFLKDRRTTQGQWLDVYVRHPAYG